MGSRSIVVDQNADLLTLQARHASTIGRDAAYSALLHSHDPFKKWSYQLQHAIVTPTEEGGYEMVGDAMCCFDFKVEGSGSESKSYTEP